MEKIQGGLIIWNYFLKLKVVNIVNKNKMVMLYQFKINPTIYHTINHNNYEPAIMDTIEIQINKIVNYLIQ